MKSRLTRSQTSPLCWMRLPNMAAGEVECALLIGSSITQARCPGNGDRIHSRSRKICSPRRTPSNTHPHLNPPPEGEEEVCIHLSLQGEGWDGDGCKEGWDEDGTI